ncbi:MAG: hypothetical protein GHCLOJNM_00888 [bacterium]|nr:hypothetical protein [bacterium]
MRITVDIDEETLAKLQEVTGIKKKSPAVARALEQYLRSVRLEELIRMAMNGEMDYPYTNEELEAICDYDPDRFFSLDRVLPEIGSSELESKSPIAST